MNVKDVKLFPFKNVKVVNTYNERGLNIELLRVEELYVSINNKEILKGVNLNLNNQEVHVIFGPNGSGKSTLLATIVGLPIYHIEKGRIIYMNEDISGLTPYERAKLGISIAFQNPPKINIRLNYLINQLIRRFKSSTSLSYEEVGIEHLLSRNLYYGFSGGEIKRVEVFLALLQRPRLALLDEPDSGVDVDSLKIIANIINELIEEGSSLIIVTHLGHILKYIEQVDKAHVLINGRIVYTDDPDKVTKIILREGYSYFRNMVKAYE